MVEETFSGHAIVKAFNREDGTVDNFNETNAQPVQLGMEERSSSAASCSPS